MTKRYPFTGIPSGWFAVASSTELKPGTVLARRYFGQELILYRTASGEARLTEAYCPHLGAHLATGTVEGENLRCPFHGFQEPGIVFPEQLQRRGNAFVEVGHRGLFHPFVVVSQLSLHVTVDVVHLLGAQIHLVCTLRVLGH